MPVLAVAEPVQVVPGPVGPVSVVETSDVLADVLLLPEDCLQV